VVVGFLLFFVLPKFVAIFRNKGAALPLPTRILIAISDSGVHYWYVWVGALVALVAGVFALRMTQTGRRGIDYLKLKTPIVGPMFRRLYITRAMHTMGTLLNAGVPMLDMIGVVRNVTGNVFFQELWDSVNDSICQGAQLSEPMGASWLLPRSIPRMIYAGERSGHLTRVVQQIADFSEAEFDDAVQRVTQFIEPLMVTVIGVVIGGVAIALLLPIFTVGRVMGGG
jgi:type IV pilus assembly protein PilC